MQSGWLLSLLFAALAGALMPAQGAVNSWLARRTSLAIATLWTHASAALIVAVLLLALPAARGSFGQLCRGPWPSLLGGVMGVAITWMVAAAVAPLGMVAATTGILVAQVLTAAVLDHFSLLGLDGAPFTWTKGFGAVFLLAGAWLLLRK
ncbi:MAG: DMT family transporter [Symbiobacteriia bacterium]